jgi:hypothetical protein
MEEEADGEHAGWIERTLGQQPRERVEAAEAKWRDIDQRVATVLERFVAEKFRDEGLP